MKIIKFLAALIIAPALVFLTAEIGRAVPRVIVSDMLAVCFLCGAALYLAVHFFVYDFSRLYVAAHELTHAAAAVFFGIRVRTVKISKRSGHVKVDGYNDAVVLAPYIFPAYFFAAAAVIFLLIRHGYNANFYKNIYAGTLGFFLSMHITHTVVSLTETKQPDLTLAGGVVYSLFIILFFNLLFLAALIAVFFPQHLPFWDTLKEVFFEWAALWQKVLNYILTHTIEFFKL